MTRLLFRKSAASRTGLLPRLVCLLACLVLATPSFAQFKEEAFTQNYNDNPDTTGRDTTDTMFSFREYFGMVKHRIPGKPGTLYAGSHLFLGGQQIYNGQAWKLPIIYSGIATGITGGIVFHYKYKDSDDDKWKHLSNWFFAGAGITYWGMLMDGIVNYPTEDRHQPGKATIYSILMPGLGQAYNGEYWKIPLYYTLIGGSVYFMTTNNKNYHRYKRIHNQATTEDSGYDGPVSAETALYYRNIFRRYRDYSIVALAASYLLQIIDANVFSYMQDFEIDDNITMNVRPAVVTMDNQYAMTSGVSGMGMSLSLRF